jgi:hypothetical protein
MWAPGAKNNSVVENLFKENPTKFTCKKKDHVARNVKPSRAP